MEFVSVLYKRELGQFTFRSTTYEIPAGKSVRFEKHLNKALLFFAVVPKELQFTSRFQLDN